jgi:hypothetical protein
MVGGPELKKMVPFCNKLARFFGKRPTFDALEHYGLNVKCQLFRTDARYAILLAFCCLKRCPHLRNVYGGEKLRWVSLNRMRNI